MHWMYFQDLSYPESKGYDRTELVRLQALPDFCQWVSS
jgi:hypothetical protein